MRDVIILGAGASGLLCALLAGRRGFSCTVVDRAPVAGRKVRLAGGGKGNVTNLHIDPSWYVGEQPKFPEQALKRCSPAFVLKMLDDFHIPWEERDYGQIFCRVQAVRLVEALVDAVTETGGRVLCGQDVGAVAALGADEFTHDQASRSQTECGVQHQDTVFRVTTSAGMLEAPRLVVATGSPAYPSAGASDMGMRLARQWGHKIIPVRPVLVPLVCPESWPLHGLAGVSLPVRVRVGDRHFEYPLLFTHKGLSGPATLQASCFWRSGMPVQLDFLPGVSLLDLFHAPEHGKLTVQALCKKLLPARLAERLIPTELAGERIAQLSKQARKVLADAMHAHSVIPTRSEGMGKAEAAAGGIETSQVNPRNCESRLRSGLYCTGEVLDVTGLLGGYNLHWAWASAKACAESFR